MGISEGLALHQYINELPRKEEEAKLKAQLFKGQADHLAAQTGLLNLQMQQEQTFMQGMPEALGQTQPQAQAPVPPELAAQPAGPNPGAPTIGQIHTTATFADPDTAQMSKLSSLALRSGSMKHYATLQQGILEAQKVQLGRRTQQLQDQLAFYQTVDGGLPDVPVNAERKAELKQAMVATLHQLGKSQEAIKMLGGEIHAVQPSDTLMRTQVGGGTEAIGQSPISLGQMEYQKEAGKDAYQSGQPPPGTASAARPNPARRMPSRATVEREASAPSTGLSTNDPVQLLQTLEEQGVPPEMIQQIAPHLLKPTASQETPAWIQPAPAKESPEARKARVAHEQDLLARGIKPSDPNNPAAKQIEQQQLEGQTGIRGATLQTAAQQREAGQWLGQGLQPNNPIEPIAQQKARIEQGMQPLSEGATAKLEPLLNVRTYMEELRAIPEAKIKQYVGLLRGPLVKVQQVVTDTLNGAGKGDPELSHFLSVVNDIFYTMSRPDTGANFTEGEKAMVGAIYATGGERSYTEFKQKVDRLDKVLQTRIDTRVALVKTPRKDVDKATQKPAESSVTSAPAAPPAAPKKTPEQLEDEIRAQMGLKPRAK